jgi:hypothetical protein
MSAEFVFRVKSLQQRKENAIVAFGLQGYGQENTRAQLQRKMSAFGTKRTSRG